MLINHDVRINTLNTYKTQITTGITWAIDNMLDFSGPERPQIRMPGGQAIAWGAAREDTGVEAAMRLTGLGLGIGGVGAEVMFRLGRAVGVRVGARGGV